MAITDVHIKSGFRDYLNMTMLSSNSAIDLSSYDHVSLLVRDNRGSVTEYSSADGSPIIYIYDSSNGILQVRPSTTTFISARSPYLCMWKLFVTSTREVSVPSEDAYFRVLVDEVWS
ncbi:MAG: hypothetical protein Q7R49_00460 [Candidatus Daviesbacteria bacterium]|nr:hypothetical protein [Candidatus Daviesbacteria bacterium]